MKIKILFLGMICVITMISFSQESKKTDIHGYLSGMPSLIWQSTKDTTIFYQQNLIHNRINFYWYPSSTITFSAQLRNQFLHGDFVEMSDYESGFKKGSYFLPLSLYIPFEKKYLLYSSLDRLWLQYTYENLEVKVGRQRINWSQTFAWNPNDIFNTYNFFDFDYTERPGADAIKIQYYTGMISSLEMAVKIDSSKNITAALLYKFNKWDYDIQLLAGQYGNTVLKDTTLTNVNDLVAGLGWSGRIKNISFRGELTYLHPTENMNDTSGLFYASLGADYGFQNEAFVNIEFFYSDIPESSNSSDFFSFYGGNKSVKNLTPAHYNLFGQVTYPFSRIFSGSLSGMYFFDDNMKGIFAGPYFDLSVMDNLDASLNFQIFGIQVKDSYTMNKMWTVLNFAFLRLKYSF